MVKCYSASVMCLLTVLPCDLRELVQVAGFVANTRGWFDYYVANSVPVGLANFFVCAWWAQKKSIFPLKLVSLRNQIFFLFCLCTLAKSRQCWVVAFPVTWICGTHMVGCLPAKCPLRFHGRTYFSLGFLSSIWYQIKGLVVMKCSWTLMGFSFDLCMTLYKWNMAC